MIGAGIKVAGLGQMLLREIKIYSMQSICVFLLILRSLREEEITMKRQLQSRVAPSRKGWF